jgi:phosphoribulokinase
VYEHATGTLTRPQYVQPTQFMIVEGLLGFSTATLRQFYDLSQIPFAPPVSALRRLRATGQTPRMQGM